MELCTQEGFSRIEIQVDEGVEAGSPEFVQVLQDLHIHVGLADVKDCFHRMRQPLWLARHFCLRPVEAHVVGMTGQELEGKVLQSNDLVYPCPGSLCMGFTWSLFFAQRADELQASLAPELKDSRLLTE